MKTFTSILVSIIFSSSLFAQQKFEAVTEDVGLEVNTNNLGQAVGWGDIDNDGDLDLAYSYSNPADFKLYRNDGGIYTDITSESGLAGIAAWTIIWAEVTGDTLNDLITRNSLYINNGDNTFSPAGTIAGQISSLADFNNDGHLDLFDRSIPGIKLGDGNGNFNEEHPLDVEGVRTTVCFDYDLDGDMDIMTGTSSYYENKLFRNDGNMVFTDVSAGSGLLMENNIYGVAAGDINNDGYPDIYAAVHKDQLQDPGNYLFKNNGDGTFIDITVSSGAIGQQCSRTASFADVNNDGWLDILIDDHYFGNHLYLNNGNVTFDEVAEEMNIRDVSGSWEIGGDYFGTSWGDYNLDGAIDFFGSGHMSRQKLFENQNCPNNFLNLELTGTISNYNAIGTRVELITGDMHTYHTIIAGDGGNNIHSFPLEIGLGENTIIDEIRIYWPNSEVQNIYNTPANTFLKIIEGEPVAIQENNSSLDIEIFPNPADEFIRLNIHDSHSPLMGIEIIDLLGNRIHQETISENAEIRKLSHLKNGIYILKLQSSNRFYTQKFIIRH